MTVDLLTITTRHGTFTLRWLTRFDRRWNRAACRTRRALARTTAYPGDTQ